MLKEIKIDTMNGKIDVLIRETDTIFFNEYF